MRFFLALSFVITVASANVIPRLSYADLFSSPVEGRITNGDEARPGQFPYICGFNFAFGNGQAFCGSVLISNQWVLTAAHCVEKASNVTVTLGAHNIKDKEEKSQVRVSIPQENLFVHKGWSQMTLQNDIALVKLPEPIEFNDRIQPASLPKFSDAKNTFEGKRVVASGWGKDSDSATGVSPVLRYIEVDVMRQRTCSRYYFGAITDNNICINTKGGTSTCNGDSGGPLVYRDNDENVVVGLTSFGIALGCEVGWPAVFTRVSGFLDWIDAKTGLVKP